MDVQEYIERFEAPNGRVFGIVQDQIHGNWYVNYSDSKGGLVPDCVAGLFTNEARAEEYLRANLISMWNHATKLTRKRELRAHKEAYEESVASG